MNLKPEQIYVNNKCEGIIKRKVKLNTTIKNLTILIKKIKEEKV